MTTTTERLSPDDLLYKLRNSAFNRSFYGVDISLYDFFKNISMYTHGKDYVFTNEGEDDYVLELEPARIFECVPVFQRDNDKWTEAMQISFMENLLSGCKTTLMFYEVSEDSSPNLTQCMLIDGLQRMTAIYRFLINEIPVMGYTYKELMEARVMFKNRITVRLANYTFKSEIEAVQFYIEMNENISHSASDIKKAKDYLASLIAADAPASK